MDDFIERSTALLAARPDTARVSMRYTHKKTFFDKESTVGNARPAVVVFKTYDPVSGALFKIRVSKANELSRVLSSLGPQHVEISKPSGVLKKRGLASLMSDVEPSDQPAVVEQQQQPADSGAAKGSKKKNKKKK